MLQERQTGKQTVGAEWEVSEFGGTSRELDQITFQIQALVRTLTSLS